MRDSWSVLISWKKYKAKFADFVDDQKQGACRRGGWLTWFHRIGQLSLYEIVSMVGPESISYGSCEMVSQKAWLVINGLTIADDATLEQISQHFKVVYVPVWSSKIW